jgi:subtilisin family serine protease
MTRRRLLTVAVTLIALFGLVASVAGIAGREQVVRVLVKVRSPLAKDIESALPLTEMVLVPGLSGNAHVESFLSRHSARKIAPLYPEIVRLKNENGLSDIEIATGIRKRFAKRANRLRAEFQPPEISRTYVLELSSMSREGLAEILRDLRADPDVEFAEEDKIVSANFTPNDPYFSSSGTWGQSYDDLWGIKKIGAPAAWDTNTGAGVIVAVVDTGIDYNHPDIASNVWINTKEIPGNGIDDDHNGYIDDVRGWDFIGSTYTNPQQSNDPIDHAGHGTHVAGTIAAVGNNGMGVIGVAWHAQVMAVKALDDQGNGLDSTLGPAILYAANNGADVINASWDGPGSSQTIADAVSYAYNLGAVFVAAAGNNSGDALNFYPANLWNAITVAASDPNDNLAIFSNFGSKIDVAAPGVDILSLQASGTHMGITVSPGYTRASGTSMATPHVSGLAALILSQNQNYSNEDVRQVLRVSATDLGTAGFDLSYGYGRINSSAALGVPSVLEAKINSPADGTVTQGVLAISGVARGSGFSHYTLDYGAGALPSLWTTIQTSTSPTSGTLGMFDTTSLAGGVYDVRLTAYNNTSGQSFVDRIQVVVHSIFILSPVPPKAPTSSTTFKNGVVIPISGTAVGGSFQNFQVDWAAGLDPNSGWQTAGITLAGGGLSPVTSGLLASWDTSSISGAGFYTIRLTVNSGNILRQVLTMVYFEPDLLSANWPQLLDQGSYFSAGVLPATNPDGSIRLVVQSPVEGPGAGEFWTLPLNGTPQQTLLPGLGSFQQPAVADLDGYPGEEAAVADSGGIVVVRQDNALYPLTTSTTLDYQRSQIIIEDLAGDSHWETLALGSDYNSQLAYVSAWRADGTVLNHNFPIQIADQNPVKTWYNRSRLLAGDVDGDGKKEIVVQEGLSPTTFTLRLFANDGSPRTWNVPVLTGMPEAMVAADLDHNGKLETILVSYSGTQANVHVFQPDGTERTGWPLALPNPDQHSQSFLAVGDLNRDGHDEIVYAHETYLYVFKDDGTLFSSVWPLQTGTFGYGSVVIGDVDGDGFPEIVTTLNSVASTSDPFFIYGNRYYDEKLLALHRDGTISKSWQLTGRSGYDLSTYPAPAIGDFNQDGITDIAVAYEVTGSPTSVPGVVTIISTGAKFNPALNDWPLVHHDPRNTSVLQSSGASTSSTATTITSSVNPSVFGQPVTLTAAVAPVSFGANAPSGQVNFVDGSTNIGSCTLAPGNCTFVTSSLAVGTHAISAQYAGDAHSTVSTSLGLSQVINSADFSVSGSAAQAVNAGSPAVYIITVASNPSPYNFAVTNFACSGLPAGAACSFNPSSVTPGNSSGTTTLTISTMSRTLAMARPHTSVPGIMLAACLSTSMFGLLGILAPPDKRKQKKMGLFFGLLLFGCIFAVACGGGSSTPQPNPNGTPAGPYTVTVTATGNGGVIHNTTVALDVN